MLTATTNEIRVSQKNFPDELGELLLAYERKEISGYALVKLLSESGYRQKNGGEFTLGSWNSNLLHSAGYRDWKTLHGLGPVSKRRNQRDHKVVENPQNTSTETDQLTAQIKKLLTSGDEVQRLKSKLAQIKQILDDVSLDDV